MTKDLQKRPSLRVTRGDLPTQLANRIGRRIANGALKPGDQMKPETHFLDETGVSRTTLREAVKPLVSKGLVEAKPKSGTRAHMGALIDDAQNDIRRVLERGEATMPGLNAANDQA